MTASPQELRWDPPGAGQWFPVLDHMPKPVCRLFMELFPYMAAGSLRSAELYGTPARTSRWATVNDWFFAGEGDPVPFDPDRLDATARETLETRRWRAEPRKWLEEERPATVAGNLGLQDEQLADLDDAALADHLRRAIEHYAAVSPLHFAHQGFSLAAGSLIAACEEWGVPTDRLLDLFTGASPATTAARDHVERIAAALRAAGVTRVASLDDVRRGGPAAAEALDDYLRVYGHRLLENRDLVDPTLGERPELVATTIDAALGGGPFAGAARRPEPDVAAVRALVPEDERGRFDELLADARACFALGDDDEGICFLWPLGLVRRAVLEIGRRLADRGMVTDPAHLLDADSTEILGLLRGATSPADQELARRAAARRAAGTHQPPASVGEPLPRPEPPPLPPHVTRLLAIARKRWSGHGTPPDEPLHGTGVGVGVYRGRACVVTDGVDALDRIAPGDVLVAVATNPGFNAVFPIVGAVVTEEGGALCHAALLARELGLPGVVGTQAISRIRDGDTVEVDADRGVVRVTERAGGVAPDGGAGAEGPVVDQPDGSR